MIKIKKILKDNKIYFSIKMLEYCCVGNRVIYNSEEYFVLENILKLENNILTNEIIMLNINDLKIEPIYNEKIRGSSLEARVIKLINQDNKAFMKVDFKYGLDKKKSSYQTQDKNYVNIPYKTFYSKINTGLFPTPEIDDIVDVVFYDKDENNLKVSWALENDESYRFNDLNNRCFKSEYIDLILSKENFELNSKNYINFNSKNVNIKSKNYTLNSEDNIAVASNGYLGFESNDEVSIYGNKINLKSKKGNIEIDSSLDVYIKGKTIHND